MHFFKKEEEELRILVAISFLIFDSLGLSIKADWQWCLYQL